MPPPFSSIGNSKKGEKQKSSPMIPVVPIIIIGICYQTPPTPLPLQIEEDRTAQSHDARHRQFHPRRSCLSPCVSPGDVGNDGDGGEVATAGSAGWHHEFDSDTADAGAGVGNHRTVEDGKREQFGARGDGCRGTDDDQRGSDGGVVPGDRSWGWARPWRPSDRDGTDDFGQSSDADGGGADGDVRLSRKSAFWFHPG